MLRTIAASAVLGAAMAASPTCIGESGKPVDWFFLLKGNSGNASFYTEGDKSFVQTDSGMGSDRGSVPWTIEQMYEMLPESYAYAFYNDQTDDGRSSSARAHAKGVLLFDAKQGFWLIHSLPKYPARRSTGYKGLSDDSYGQSFICLTLPTSQLDDIGKQLAILFPQWYDVDMTDDLDSVAPHFKAAAIDDKRNSTKTSIIDFKTVGGKTFTHYAKSTACACELWEDVVAPGLDTGLYVESWMNGALDNKIPTSCKSGGANHNVQDILNTTMRDGTGWTETRDHSKWAVTDGTGVKAACVGDINRQYSQSKRGGGGMCVTDAKIHNAFDEIITGVWDPC